MSEQLKGTDQNVVNRPSLNTELTTHNGFRDTTEIVAQFLPIKELVKVYQAEPHVGLEEGDDE